ncbi:hypothetical protein JHK85_005653 [Glycine max]|nr:hypothetical protein JHK85_005653 [Glycine max]KAG5081427.1 hypothetical protein JHK86_005492 [Glycine max]
MSICWSQVAVQLRRWGLVWCARRSMVVRAVMAQCARGSGRKNDARWWRSWEGMSLAEERERERGRWRHTTVTVVVGATGANSPKCPNTTAIRAIWSSSISSLACIATTQEATISRRDATNTSRDATNSAWNTTNNAWDSKLKDLELEANALIFVGGKVSVDILPLMKLLSFAVGVLPDHVPKVWRFNNSILENC